MTIAAFSLCNPWQNTNKWTATQASYITILQTHYMLSTATSGCHQNTHRISGVFCQTIDPLSLCCPNVVTSLNCVFYILNESLCLITTKHESFFFKLNFWSIRGTVVARWTTGKQVE